MRFSEKTVLRKIIGFFEACGYPDVQEEEIFLEEGERSWYFSLDVDYFEKYGVIPHHEDCPNGYVHKEDGLIEGPYGFVRFDPLTAEAKP